MVLLPALWHIPAGFTLTVSFFLSSDKEQVVIFLSLLQALLLSGITFWYNLGQHTLHDPQYLATSLTRYSEAERWCTARGIEDV